MQLSKQHFEFIAEILKSKKPEKTDREAYGLWVDLVREFGIRLLRTNTLFDSTKFIQACGFYDEN